ncbi:MAG TPA: carbamoyltransferase HypF [Phycisphaerae bacterium]|jgi:hydrogenase maturation protein HypF|nr:carbamoyltransferase HypF [Phycisphaerae bacterium]HOB74585.1 carbamoyltransferase HypF [Phycisphaerae bacterium]HOJ53540.1 carbamoyltransferase HypF [Phycisphaerae bacterium]HOL25303.1 carbamoyltransferase HypF [Phycisphaerae bacterium]HPP20482.1 carbamoyltransferase HypF [Phycisphaerae bacterium]
MNSPARDQPEAPLRENSIANTLLVRRRLDVRGRVQGVGFRPFVYRLARELRLSGLVGNDSHGAFIEVEGPAAAVEAFLTRLRGELPPLARISSLSVTDVPLRHDPSFRIETSVRSEGQDAEIAPDVAICDDCLAELLDPADRRFRYPFINCMNCGPRYSIIRGVPYDRANTTMAVFRMCPACQAEYDHPGNRRFHAQPNACPVCGPRLWLSDAKGTVLEGDPIRATADRLRAGAIVAIKGIGGFHLACRADRDEVVERLRERKGREAKAFALMVASLDEARRLCEVDAASAAALTSVARPIVLLPKRDRERISALVAPGSEYYGVMLPYTPLHYLLFAEGLGPLVMTSANPSEEPLCRDNEEALARLAGIADAFLLNDRDIERRVDDSVVLAVGSRACGSSGLFSCSPSSSEEASQPAGAPASAEPAEGWILPIRRARGFAPAPLEVPLESPEPILAVGGELKSTVCLLAGRQAVLSEHLGELSNAAAYRNFVETIGRFKELLRLDPAVVAYDLHPEYAATRYARSLGLKGVGVQHHHAHIVSCMAENGIDGPVVGVACDGTGYGTDGAIWGCEILVCEEAAFTRAGHLDYFPLLGGDASARDTWRPAAGLLHATYGADWTRAADYCLRRVAPEAVAFVAGRLARGIHRPLTSSLGRLFDAVAFLLGVCDRNRYEAEAAMSLEALARQQPPAGPLAFEIHGDISSPVGDTPRGAMWSGEPLRLDVRPMVRELVERARSLDTGRPAHGIGTSSERVGALARAFQDTLATMLVEAVRRVARRTHLERVVLSGGCFANRLLTESVCAGLTAAGFKVFTHQRVPTGDGGIALGQAVAAAQQLRRNR